MTFVAIHDVGDLPPWLNWRAINREIRHLVVTAILNAHFRNRSRQQDLCTPTTQPDCKSSVRATGHGVVERIRTQAVAPALGPRCSAFGYVPWSRNIRTEACVAVVR